MDVKKTVKNKDGTISFKGTMTQEEHDYVIAVGLNYLVEQGYIALSEPDLEEEELEVSEVLSKLGPGSSEMQ
jgi:hypothetical protein